VKIWRPKDPKAIALIKLTLWAGLVTWCIFTVVAGIAFSRLTSILLPQVLGLGTWGTVWTWIVGIWIIFVSLMLIWAVMRFANKKLRSKKEDEEE